ncbi:BACON domain-containing protein [Alistipes communis]|uniref:BACON domain-containing protein n=1 Tax=Alistipes communis TaxID=2585118 RepID=UPI0022E4E7A1|nr:BACON domain-containing carbohydrate-binding protein [Alistipes communis]
MRKMQKTLMLVAAAAMALAGCSKEDVSDNALPGSGTKATRGFTAEIASSRTTLNGDATRMKWTAGDQLGFYTDVETDLNVASSTYAEGATNFTAEIDTKATKVYAYYPYFKSQMDKDTPRTHENVSLYIEDAQTQTETGVLNGNMVGMYASATLAEGQNTVLTFTPIASLIAFNIYDAENNGDAVKSITFTPAGGEKLNGQHIYNLETGKTTDTGYKESATVTLTTPYAVPAAKPADKAGYIYLAVTPKSYAGGTFTVVTDKNTYTFETTKVIDASNVYAPVVIPMNLVAATPAEDYSGTYVVLAKEGSTYFALAGMNNNNTTRLDAVPFEYNGTDTPISVTDPEIVWTVTKSGNAYTLSNEGKYLSYSGSGNTAAVNSTPYNLTLLKDTANGTYNIKSETVSNRVLAKYNTDNAYFAFYTTGGNNNLYLVPVDYKQLPIIDLSTNSAILDYNDETVHEITATITDASSVIAAAYSTEEGSVESNWLVASYENGKISYFASVNNTDKARTAYIVVSATNANGTRKEIITVVQNIQAQGTEVTFNYGDLYSHVPSKGNVDVTEDTVEGVTAKYEKISGSNPPKYYDNGKNLRIYNKSMMTISAPTGSSIIKIEFTASKWTADSGTVTADIGTLTSKTWTGESEHVVFTFTATNNIESFVVTYK